MTTKLSNWWSFVFGVCPKRASGIPYLAIFGNALTLKKKSYIVRPSLSGMLNHITSHHLSQPFPLQWRNNDHDSVSNHQPHGCLLNHLFRRRSKKTSKLRVTGLYVGNSPGPVNSPHKGPVTRKMFPFDDVIMIFENRSISSVCLLWCVSSWAEMITCQHWNHVTTLGHLLKGVTKVVKWVEQMALKSSHFWIASREVFDTSCIFMLQLYVT